jgi:heme exporter protein D
MFGRFESLEQFLAMGGYAAYVWPSYGVSALLIGGLIAWSMAANARARKTVERLEAERKAGP